MAKDTARLRVGLQGIAKFLKIECQKTLKQKGKRATGNLINTIDVVVSEILNGFEITETHLLYGTFVAKGRKPGTRRVPVDAIEAWLKQRGFAWAADNTRGKAFAVQTNIFKFGIKPTNWIAETLSRTEQKMFTMIEKVAHENLEIIIGQIFKETDRKLKVTV